MRILSFLLALLFCQQLAADVQLIVRPIPMSFPMPTVEDLNRGYMFRGPLRTTQGIVIRVRSDRGKTWRLLMRGRDGYFHPQILRKPIAHLQWKNNQDDGHAYQDLTEYDQTILISRGGGDRDIRLDFRLQTGWDDTPAAYSTDLIFSVRED